MAIIVSDVVLDALVDAGVIRREDRARRVVIDVQAGHAIAVHVERVGDQKLLNVIPALVEAIEGPKSRKRTTAES